MKYYKVEMVIEEAPEASGEHEAKKLTPREIFQKMREINITYNEFGTIFVSESAEMCLILGVIMDKPEKLDEVLSGVVRTFDIEVSDIDKTEINLGDLVILAHKGEYDDVIRSLSRFSPYDGVAELIESSRRNGMYSEDMADTMQKKPAMDRAEALSFGAALTDELERIYHGSPKRKCYGYPVKYIIETSAEEVRDDTKHLLASALYSNNRVINSRYGTLSIRADRFILRHSFIRLIYRCAEGGMLFVDLSELAEQNEDDIADGGMQILEGICRCAKENADEVLTVFMLPAKSDVLCKKIFDFMEIGAFVNIREEGMGYDNAAAYLKSKASKKSVRADKKLNGFLEKDKTYYVKDLNRIFSEWFDDKLRSSIYRQYSDVASIRKVTAEKEAKGDAYMELEKMIGLKSAKKIINEAISLHKAQKVFAAKGLKKSDMSMHMVFTGNPGTAKTTVARLFAKILRDNEIIKSGSIVEVGRGDLVGKYVGWTAPTIQEKFRAAVGGVLFIDEAYSLVDDRNGSYGDEAINTIVQEMENHRHDVIVIFAGYPDKMEQFMDKNPGLRSRIAFHVKFEDYSADELCDITELLASGMGLKIDPKARPKLYGIMEQASMQHDFGNGRFARNVIEKARMAQAERLIGMDFDAVTAEDVATICEEDLEDIEYKPVKKNVIGFAS